MVSSSVRARRWTAAAAVVIAVAVPACSSGDGEGTERVSASSTTTGSDAGSSDASGADESAPVKVGEDTVADFGTYEVVHTTMTLVDDTRPTAAHGGEPAQPERTLPTDVWYPEVKGGVRLPLIVFSHGSTRLAEHYSATIEAWVSAGYVVVGPNFPLSKEGTPGGTDYGGIADQARDVSFVIDEVLASVDNPDRTWARLVDPERIGLGGQSFGAITTMAVAANPCCADDRVGAVTSFAGVWFDLGEQGTIEAADAPPALLVHGDADPTLPYAMGEALFDLYPGERRLLTLVGTGHDPGYFEGLDEPLDAMVTRATLAFYDQHLKGAPDGARRLEEVVAGAGPEVATLSDVTSDPKPIS